MIEFIFRTKLPKSSNNDCCCSSSSSNSSGGGGGMDRVIATANGDAIGCSILRRSIADFSQADSYENFDKEEGKCSDFVENCKCYNVSFFFTLTKSFSYFIYFN
ncbi:unnamed protein product [Cercopithifilaria johnstoni]|uniref:Uncharacterized protein n=1 Tax=Cercopithifilaria johnstoni TaxID=2874296 RepID=A0A8J2M9Y5_9BILA|nr:unnamed protein product [Cercopithifilaria johnstoni]